jgi:hypothetical protein
MFCRFVEETKNHVGIIKVTGILCQFYCKFFNKQINGKNTKSHHNKNSRAKAKISNPTNQAMYSNYLLFQFFLLPLLVA